MEMELKRKIAEGTVCTQWQVIKLTDEEIEQVYRERRLYYNIEDIKSKVESMIEEYEGEPEEEKLKAKLNDAEWLRDTAEWFDNALENNDGFMESFWMTAEEVIKEGLEEDADDGEGR